MGAGRRDRTLSVVRTSVAFVPIQALVVKRLDRPVRCVSGDFVPEIEHVACALFREFCNDPGAHLKAFGGLRGIG